MKIGCSLTKDDAWLLEIAKIPEELREEEAELRNMRWFDYRTLMGAQATYLFSKIYDQVYRETYAQTRDYRDAATVRVLISHDIFKSVDLLPMWRARQEADRIGCKYEFYLRFAFKRFWDRGWKYLPRPNQIYGEELTLDIRDSWEEMKRCGLQVATNPRYQPNAYVGHPDQDAYHAHLVEQVKNREHQYMTLSRLVFKEQVLPLHVAERHFDADVLNRARSYFSHR